MSSPAPRTLASFWLDLPREGRLLLSVVVFEFVGSGLVLPFWVVYLHELRGYSLSVVGLLLALMSLAGFLASIACGTLIDRSGPRVALLWTLVMAIAGEVLVAFAGDTVLVVLAITVIGAGFGMGWPSGQAMIASVVPAEIRSRYFGINFSLLNLGIGIGGILGGSIAHVTDLRSFQVLYLGDAISYLPSLVLMLVPLRHAGAAVPHAPADSGGQPSYLTVLRAPAMRTLTLLMFLSAFVGYAQLNSGMPAYSRAIGEVSPRGLGYAFAANTAVIVLLQLWVLRRIEGRRRTRVIAAMGVIWAASWGLLSASGIAPGTLGANLAVAACASVFAFGETLLQPTIPVIVNDLAPEHLRGRYNALGAGVFQLASILGPVVAGVLIGHGLHLEYLGLLVVGCVATSWMAVARLEPQLDERTNGLFADEPAIVPLPIPVED
jgi:MFS family permease